MKDGSFRYSALGLIAGAAAGIVLYALLGSLWWVGLVVVGLVVGAAMDGMR